MYIYISIYTYTYICVSLSLFVSVSLYRSPLGNPLYTERTQVGITLQRWIWTYLVRVRTHQSSAKLKSHGYTCEPSSHRIIVIN